MADSSVGLREGRRRASARHDGKRAREGETIADACADLHHPQIEAVARRAEIGDLVGIRIEAERLINDDAPLERGAVHDFDGIMLAILAERDLHRLPGIRLDAPAPDPAYLDAARDAPQTQMHWCERLQGEAWRLGLEGEGRIIGVIAPDRCDAVLPFPTELREPRGERHHGLVEPYQRGAGRQIARRHRFAASKTPQEMRQAVTVLADQLGLRRRDDLADTVGPD